MADVGFSRLEKHHGKIYFWGQEMRIQEEEMRDDIYKAWSRRDIGLDSDVWLATVVPDLSVIDDNALRRHQTDRLFE